MFQSVSFEGYPVISREPPSPPTPEPSVPHYRERNRAHNSCCRVENLNHQMSKHQQPERRPGAPWIQGSESRLPNPTRHLQPQLDQASGQFPLLRAPSVVL